jgi:hypothetical protein
MKMRRGEAIKEIQPVSKSAFLQVCQTSSELHPLILDSVDAYESVLSPYLVCTWLSPLLRMLDAKTCAILTLL